MIHGTVECGVVKLLVPIDQYKEMVIQHLDVQLDIQLYKSCPACYNDVTGPPYDLTIQHNIYVR